MSPSYSPCFTDLRTVFVFALGLSVPSQDGKFCPRILVLRSYYKGYLAQKLYSKPKGQNSLTLGSYWPKVNLTELNYRRYF